MNDLERALLHGTAGLRAMDEAASGDLGEALRDQAISEWAADRPVSRPVRPAASRIPFRYQALAVAVAVLVILVLAAVH